MPPQEYPHLPFVGVEVDRARLNGGGSSSPQTDENKRNRQAHADRLKAMLDHLSAWWGEQKAQRATAGLPEAIGIPLWIKIDPNADNAEFLRGMGFCIVSEEEDGFVLVAADDQTFVVSGQKLDDFRNELPRKDRPASIYEIGQPETETERIRRILPEKLQDSWQTTPDYQTVIVDLSISCDVKQPSDSKPREEGESDEHFEGRVRRRETRIAEMLKDIDDLQQKREAQIERYVSAYRGEILKCYGNNNGAEFPDSFTMRVSISGQGFKDIVRTFPYLFMVESLEDVVIDESGLEPSAFNYDVTISEPEEGAPSVCVIDSGMQEGHRLLALGINPSHSRNFIPSDSPTDTADYVDPIGHGTPVAGNVLFPESIPEHGELRLSGFVQNAKILNAQNQLPDSVLPALYIDQIVSHYHEKYKTRIFNHSINARVPYRSPHMSTWAASIDKISYQRDVLVIQSVGNIRVADAEPIRFGLQNHLQEGRDYPEYVHAPSCRLANPAQSFQALTVGAISNADYNDGARSAIAGKDRSSALSRSGPGIWGSIKPEVVEVGGDLVKTDTIPVLVSQHRDVSPPLIQSTRFGQPAVGQQCVGTSFAAPRVSGLAMQLQSMMPNESALLLRALIANSARWPTWAEQDADPLSVIHRIGYGRPDSERAIGNDPHRVTLVVSGEDLYAREAKLFRVPVPDRLRAAESNFDVRIDITLSYSAMPRRTRRGHRQYLSCRLDWKCSAKGQTEDAFRNDLFMTDNEDRDYEAYFDWNLRNEDDRGKINGVSRNRGTLQKDWAIAKSHELPEDFLVGVVGHPGWDKANQYPARFALVVSFELVNREIEIYEDVRVLLEQLQVGQHADVALPVENFDTENSDDDES
jgi:hypothetical protein